MSTVAAPRLDVHFGEVSGSQLVIGDHNTIQTPKGAKVTVLAVGERPVPRLRSLPLAHRPPLRVEALGREVELARAASASAASPMQVYGPVGIGKTVLLKSVAHALHAPEGVVFETARRRTLDEILAALYSACWECDLPYLPTPAEVGAFIVDREVLVVLDDCALDRDDLEALTDSAPGSTFVIGSEERTLGSYGVAQELRGLPRRAALRLLERELGELRDKADRDAADTLVRRLEGPPQQLVEAAALVGSGKVSLPQLAGTGGEPAEELARRINYETLTGADRRILTLLGLLAGAALGTPQVAAAAELPDAAERLRELERRGWVKSNSPRYRLVRSLPLEDDEALRNQLADSLVDHLTELALTEAMPAAIVDQAEAIEAMLALAARDGRWNQALRLAVASESKLAQSGAWVRWRRVLLGGLEAARMLGDAHAEAHMLHQLGSLALCLGEGVEASAQLGEALQLRERLGDSKGAELTRHNLRQLSPGGSESGGRPEPGGGPRWPRPPILLAILAIVVAAVVGLVAMTHSGSSAPAPVAITTGDRSTASTATVTQTPTHTAPPAGTTSGAAPGGSAQATPPTITINVPRDGDVYEAGTTVLADFTCADAHGAQTPVCGGSAASGSALDMTPGPHTFVVNAKDAGGTPATQTVNYVVQGRSTPPATQLPPTQQNPITVAPPTPTPIK